jgi:hypothetical protein
MTILPLPLSLYLPNSLIEAAGAAISKGHLHVHDRFLAIRYTVLKAQNKISKQTYIA